MRVAVAVATGLATACVIWVSAVGLFLAALFEVWPLSLKQGPDTTFSRACYAEFLGGPPPPTVTEIYCRREWGFGGDDVYSLRFTFRERSTVQQVVERLQLQAVTGSEHGDQRNGRAYLWVDFEGMAAFHQDARF
jgi:hypothetical protein